ncbi:MAG: restriction endonuclease [Actinomycetota bacterium]|nr:restriction endonuclease [Actinomycetota bacterium]
MAPAEDLASALQLFDRAAANLAKLSTVWGRIQERQVEGIAFGEDTTELDDLIRAFDELASALPPVNGFAIRERPWSNDEIAQARLDARDVGFPDAITGTERAIDAPGREIGEYRHRLHLARRSIVRTHVEQVIAEIDALLSQVQVSEGGARWPRRARWGELSELVGRLDRLVGDTVPGHARWGDLRRHLRFAEPNDLHDIKTMDWPSVKHEVIEGLYGEQEPVPVPVDDLGALARSAPTGPVGTQLPWENVSDDDFERLVFELIRDARGYENTNWLMRTNAADRGRDIETYRVVEDALGETRRYRVIVQCKHWTSRSVGRGDLVNCVEAVKLWQPPRVDVLVVATSGRFSQDAVAKKEQWGQEGSSPMVELWPDSHLETLLSRRPDLTARFGLR